jgi:hypothetical protein
MIEANINGKSKTGKGCIGDAMYDGLVAQGYQAKIGVAGNFFRRVDRGTIDRVLECKRNLNIMDDPTEVEPIVAGVLQDRIAYDDTYPWGDLQDPLVGNTVGKVARLKITQAAGEEWYYESAMHALESGADVYIVDGRNPRDRLAEFRARTGTKTGLDLVLECDVDVAAYRVLRGAGIEEPTPLQIEQQAKSIADRRTMDANPLRPNAYIDPDMYLSFVPGEIAPNEVVAYSFELYGEESPCLYGSTTPMFRRI